jgi:hypothetical protein
MSTLPQQQAADKRALEKGILYYYSLSLEREGIVLPAGDPFEFARCMSATTRSFNVPGYDGSPAGFDLVHFYASLRAGMLNAGWVTAERYASLFNGARST